MKSLLSIGVVVLLLVGCQDRPVEVRIEKWHQLGHSIERLREMAPDRPLVVFFYLDWDLGGQVILRELDEPQVYDLLTEFKVLPMLANYTDMSGFEVRELKLHGLERMGEHCFLVVKPSGDVSWIAAKDLHGGKVGVRLLELLRAAVE